MKEWFRALKNAIISYWCFNDEEYIDMITQKEKDELKQELIKIKKVVEEIKEKIK